MPDVFGAMLLDDERTWPRELLSLFEEGLDRLKEFERFRSGIDKLAKTNFSYRLSPPDNPHAEFRKNILVQADSIAAKIDIVGWHCTRLLDVEISGIISGGLRVLSSELIFERLRTVRAMRILGAAEVETLMSDSQVKNSSRTGRLYIVLSKPILCHASAVHPLLAHWGGEALYWAHADDFRLAPLLRSIGQPCIIEVAQRASEVNSYCSPGERAMQVFLHRRAVETGLHSMFEGHVLRDVTPSRIRRVIRRHDVDFEALTGCSGWMRPYEI